MPDGRTSHKTAVEKRLSRVAREGGSVTLRKLPCERCGHSPDDHRLDDSLNIGPVDPRAQFRCIGHTEGDRWIDTNCGCPDFQGEVFGV